MKNVCIWKMEKDLNEISQLLKNSYKKIIPSLVEQNIVDEDKYLLHKWTVTNGSDISRKKIVINGEEYRVIKCVADVEYKDFPEDLWIDKGQVISKDIRIKKKRSYVNFININQGTYCIVSGQKSNEGRIRSNLMQSRVKKELSSWGSIESKVIPEYKFDKEFYYWLIINKGNTFPGKDDTVTSKDDTIKLVNVKGFRSDAERNETSYSGEGADIDSEIPLMSLISMNETLVSLYIDVLYKNKINYSFYLDCDGRISVCEMGCGEFATQTPKGLPFDNIIMDIYFKIIPLLLKYFNKDKVGNWNNTCSDFQKKLSIGIIIELAKQNSLTIENIVTAMDSSKSFKNEFEDKTIAKEITVKDQEGIKNC